MKKYLLSTLAVAGLMVCATTASAEPVRGPYVLGEAGYSFGTKNNDDAAILGLGTGYHINDYLRTDLTVSYRGWGKVDFKEPGAKKADVWSIPVMANLYASYPIHRMFDIYAMGGIGVAFNKTDSITNAKGKTKTNFAWQVGAGIDYMINNCWSLDLGYRYSDLGNARVKEQAGFTGRNKQDMRSHDVKLTARYYF